MLQELQLSRDVYSRNFSVDGIVSHLSAAGFDTREFSSRVEGLMTLAKGVVVDLALSISLKSQRLLSAWGSLEQAFPFDGTLQGLRLFPGGGMQREVPCGGFGIF